MKPVQWGQDWQLKMDDSELQGFTVDKPKREDLAEEQPGRPRRRLRDLSRRQWAYVGGGSALATAIAGYFYANSGPTLEEPDEEDGEIVNMEWFEDIVIQKRQGKGWERKGKLYRANGKATNNPDPSAPLGVPPEQLNDPSQFRVTYEGRYVVHVRSHGKVVPRELSRDEYMQYRVNDQVKIRVKENGAVQGMDRTGRSK